MSIVAIPGDPRSEIQPDRARRSPPSTPPQPHWDKPPQPWSRTQPANPQAALRAIQQEIISSAERAEIQRIENQFGKTNDELERNSPAKLYEQERDLQWRAERGEIGPEEAILRAREIAQAITDSSIRNKALERKMSDLVESLRHLLTAACRRTTEKDRRRNRRHREERRRTF
jgi:hypothetical protein